MSFNSVASRKCASADSRGFVLLEAVIALAIIGLVAIALLEATSTQFRAAAKGSQLVVARSLAEDRLVALRLLNHDDFTDLPDSIAEGAFPAPYEDYAWTVTIEEMEDEYDLFTVEIAVSSFGEGGERFLLHTLVHRPRPFIQQQVGGQGGGPGQGGQGGAGGLGGRRWGR